MNIRRSIELHRKPIGKDYEAKPLMIDADVIIGFEDGCVFTMQCGFDVEESYDCIKNKINELPPLQDEDKRSLRHFEEVHTEAMAFLAGKIFGGTRNGRPD